MANGRKPQNQVPQSINQSTEDLQSRIWVIVTGLLSQSRAINQAAHSTVIVLNLFQFPRCIICLIGFMEQYNGHSDSQSLQFFRGFRFYWSRKLSRSPRLLYSFIHNKNFFTVWKRRYFLLCLLCITGSPSTFLFTQTVQMLYFTRVKIVSIISRHVKAAADCCCAIKTDQ